MSVSKKEKMLLFVLMLALMLQVGMPQNAIRGRNLQTPGRRHPDHSIDSSFPRSNTHQEMLLKGMGWWLWGRLTSRGWWLWGRGRWAKFHYRYTGIIITNYHILTDADCVAYPHMWGNLWCLWKTGKTGRAWVVVGVGGFANAHSTIPVAYTLVQPHGFWVELVLKKFMDNTTAAAARRTTR